MDTNSQMMEALLANSGSIPDFFENIFAFLASRTDFYNISSGPDDPSGLQPGVAEDIIIKSFYKHNPNILYSEECNYSEAMKRNISTTSPFLPAGKAQEVEVVTSDYQEVESFTVNLDDEKDHEYYSTEISGEDYIPELALSDKNIAASDISEGINFKSLNIKDDSSSSAITDASVQNNQTIDTTSSVETPKNVDKSEIEKSDSFNGAVRKNYSWSQNICEIDITIKLPECVKSSKQIKVTVLADSICVKYLALDKNWLSMVEDKLTYKIKTGETLWVMSEGFIRIHLEKQMERWWNSLLESEPKIDTSKLNCSRPLHDLSDDHLAKINELQFNHMQKLAGKPTSDEINTERILERAWNAPGSPFMNTPFDPSIVS